MEKIESEIKENYNKIDQSQDIINKKYKEQLELLFDMRKIMEDENNHENKLICRPLLQEKEKEYKDKMSDYKSNYEESKNEIERNKKKIDDLFNDIIKMKKDLKILEHSRESEEIQNFEMERTKIIERIIGYQKEKKINEAMIKKVEEIIKQK